MEKLKNEEVAKCISELLQNDQTNFEKLLKECERLFNVQCNCHNYSFSIYLTREDFFQDSLTLLLRYMKSYDPEKGAFSSWYSRLIEHLYYNKYRNEKKQIETVPLEIELSEELTVSVIDQIKTVPSTEDEYLHKISSNQIIAIIKSMKPIYKEALELYTFSNYSVEEAAAYLGISKKTYNVRVCRGKRELLQQIEDIEMEI